mmetsp:Transcript_38616/g.77427  ORF Transcript_38616/g.77427 Transcript_38616/m.77427 type:complete len:202 (+) Transcript_38616:919-1524(+)
MPLQRDDRHLLRCQLSRSFGAVVGGAKLASVYDFEQVKAPPPEGPKRAQDIWKEPNGSKACWVWSWTGVRFGFRSPQSEEREVCVQPSIPPPGVLGTGRHHVPEPALGALPCSLLLVLRRALVLHGRQNMQPRRGERRSPTETHLRSTDERLFGSAREDLDGSADQGSSSEQLFQLFFRPERYKQHDLRRRPDPCVGVGGQ